MIAAITAGGRADDVLARELGVSVKALATVGGTTLLARAIDSARASGARRVVIIGGADVRAHCAAHVDDVIEESLDGCENVRRAIATTEGDPLLLLSSDLPFVSGSALGAFLERARSCDLALPLAEAADYERTYPGAPPHLTRLGADRVANGSVVFFGAGVAPHALPLAQRLFDARKSLTRMAFFLGPLLLARFVTGSLRIQHIEARGKALLGLEVRAIRNAAPELCFDIDTVADYRYAREYAARA